MCITPAVNALEVFKVETMLPVCEKVFADLQAMKQEQLAALPLSAQSAHRSRRSSTSFAARTRGMHFLDKRVLWREHVISTHKSCLLALVEFVSMQKRQIAGIKERIRRADRDIPELPREEEEMALLHEMSAQWKKVGDYFREMEMISRARRPISEEALSLATLINTLHSEAQSRLSQTTSLHLRLQITLSKMGIQKEMVTAIAAEGA